MSLVSLEEALSWLGVSSLYFTITADNDGLIFTSSEGGPVTIDVTDGTYEASALATLLQTLMNADNTLTGTGTITFAVSFSSTTNKFTIDAGSGHTIEYTNTGSDGGLTFGFNADHSAAQTITSDIPAGDPSADVQQILDAVDGWLKNVYLHNQIEADDYIEYHDGGLPSVWVDNRPIITLERVTVGTIDGISLINSSSDMAYARVTIDTTQITLKIVGGANAGTDTVAFETYDDLGEIVDAINALGHGWTAALSDSTYTDYPYTELKQTTGFRVNYNTYYYLQIPDDTEYEFEIDSDTGEIRYYAWVGKVSYITNQVPYQLDRPCWPTGYRNVRVEYRGGYETIPEDIKYGTLVCIKYLYDKKVEESSGTTQYNLQGVTKIFETNMPSDAIRVLSRYRRHLI